MNQTKSKKGRPKLNSTTIIPNESTSFKKPIAREYEVISGGGIVFMLGRSEANIYDEASNSIRVIRYCPEENSIWKDEQSENSVKEGIVFKNKKLFVPASKPNLIDFLSKHPDNTANGGKVFKMINHEENAKKELESDFLFADAINLVRSKPVDDLISVATALAINTERMIDEIKHDLLVFAKKDPKTFMESFDNPVIEVKAKVKNAMTYNIISHSKGHVVWTDTNKHIIAVPEGKDPVDIFVRYCMTEAGAPVLAEIERQL